MPRVDLQVPFAQKGEAKRLGARWDVVAKLWSVPDGVDAAPFAEWFRAPIPTAVNLRCNRFFIAEGVEPCFKCQKGTRVFTFLVPQGYEKLQPEGEPYEGRWFREEHEALLWRLTWLGDAALAAMREHTANYFLDRSEGYLAEKNFNHCEHCGVKQGEGGSAGGHVFQPENSDEAERIALHYHNRPFEASCHLEDPTIGRLFHSMRQAWLDEPTEVAMQRFLVG